MDAQRLRSRADQIFASTGCAARQHARCCFQKTKQQDGYVRRRRRLRALRSARTLSALTDIITLAPRADRTHGACWTCFLRTLIIFQNIHRAWTSLFWCAALNSAYQQQRWRAFFLQHQRSLLFRASLVRTHQFATDCRALLQRGARSRRCGVQHAPARAAQHIILNKVDAAQVGTLNAQTGRITREHHSPCGHTRARLLRQATVAPAPAGAPFAWMDHLLRTSAGSRYRISKRFIIGKISGLGQRVVLWHRRYGDRCAKIHARIQRHRAMRGTSTKIISRGSVRHINAARRHAYRRYRGFVPLFCCSSAVRAKSLRGASFAPPANQP